MIQTARCVCMIPRGDVGYTARRDTLKRGGDPFPRVHTQQPPPIRLPPISLPPISLPPISLPPIRLPPVSLPISLPPMSPHPPGAAVGPQSDAPGGARDRCRRRRYSIRHLQRHPVELAALGSRQGFRLAAVERRPGLSRRTRAAPIRAR